MRTTLTIDDDVLAAARILARTRAETIGQALCDLARRGLDAAPCARGNRAAAAFPVFSVPRGARPVTLEDVQRGEDEA
jgi:hypothetical protein